MLINHFIDLHKGETIIVCGLGKSILQLEGHKPKEITIGVNDIERALIVDYLVVLNDMKEFVPERYRFIKYTLAETVFSPCNLLLNMPEKLQKFQLGTNKNPKPRKDSKLDYQNHAGSPFAAIMLAYLMGAGRIGMLGIDYQVGHFFDEKSHASASSPSGLQSLNHIYGTLWFNLDRKGVELFNLSESSLIKTVPVKAL